MEIPTIKGLETKENNIQSETKVNIVQCRSRKLVGKNQAYGTGKRKNAVARVWVMPGKGNITVNTKKLDEFFARDVYIKNIRQPLVLTGSNEQFDVKCTVKGGGTTGQSDAIANGIARALVCISEAHHPVLKKADLLTRDSRIVERKKYGRRKARKKAQFSKR